MSCFVFLILFPEILDSQLLPHPGGGPRPAVRGALGQQLPGHAHDDREPLLCGRRPAHLHGHGGLWPHQGSPHQQGAEAVSLSQVKSFPVYPPPIQLHLWRVCRGHGLGGGLHEGSAMDCRVHSLPWAELLRGNEAPVRGPGLQPLPAHAHHGHGPVLGPRG